MYRMTLRKMRTINWRHVVHDKDGQRRTREKPSLHGLWRRMSRGRRRGGGGRRGSANVVF
jgi:hypothetical protein